MKKLIILVGLPRSGKTTVAKKLAKKLDAPVVNPDSIRLALHGQRFVKEAEPTVWYLADMMVKSHFQYGYDTVILDATNTTKDRRDRWISKDWVREFLVVDTWVDICLKRSKGDSEIIEAIRVMNAKYQPVSMN